MKSDSSQAPGTIFVIDIQQARLVFMNRASLMDYSFAELQNLGYFFSLLDPDDLTRLEEAWQTEATESGGEFRLRIMNKNGTWQDLVCQTGVMTRDAGRNPVLVLVTLLGGSGLRPASAVVRSKSEERAQALAHLASQLNAETSLEQIFQIGCEQMTRALGVETTFIALYDEKSDRYQLTKIFNPVSDLFIPKDLFSQHMFQKMAFAPGKPLFIPDIRVLQATHELTMVPKDNVRTLLAVGLYYKGHKIGAAGVLTRDHPRQFSQAEITFLQTFTEGIASAIQHAQQILFEHRQTQRLMMLAEITQTALSGAGLAEFMTHLAQEMVERIGVSGCYVIGWDPSSNVWQPLAAQGPDRATFLRLAAVDYELGLSQPFLESGQVQVLEDFSAAPVFGAGLPSAQRPNLVCVLPVKSAEQVVAAILVVYEPPAPYFGEKDLPRWEEFVSQTSLGITNILMVEREKRRRKEAELLLQATYAVTSSLDMQVVLTHILTGLEEGVPYDSAAISLLEDDNLKIVALGGTAEHTRQVGDIFDKDEGLFSLLGSWHTPVVLGDAQQHPSYQQWSKSGKDPIHAWMGIPLVAYERLIGYLTLNSTARDVYTSDHARIAQAFANQAAVAIENARLFEQVRDGRERLHTLSKKLVQFQEAERRLIAHELHDEIGQELTGLQFILEMGKDGTPEQQIGAFNEGQKLVEGLMSQVRELSLNLCPAMLDDLGLLPTLTSHMLTYQQRTGIHVNFKFENLARRFAPEVEISAFRVVQEALTNVARYAGVKNVDILASANELFLRIEVIDRGRGFDMAILNNTEQCFGITGMRERTLLTRGLFEVYSQPDQGTQVCAMFPIGEKLERRRHDRTVATR